MSVFLRFLLVGAIEIELSNQMVMAVEIRCQWLS